MERLVIPNKAGSLCYNDTDQGLKLEPNEITSHQRWLLLERLHEYEDTGLTPEQIREMKELLSRESTPEITRSSRDNEVTEYCPHCDREITVLWNVEQDGYQIFCPNCGEPIMLCSMCDREPCNWTENGCEYSDERYGKRREQK